MRAVIFDLFGTLVKAMSKAEMDASLRDMARCLGAPGDGFVAQWHGDTALARHTGVLFTIEENLVHICEYLSVAADASGIAEAVALRDEAAREALTPRADAVATLDALRARGLRVGLVSDCSGDVPALWPETALAERIDEAIFSCSVGLKKPDPRIYHLACERLGIEPRDCLYVGDGDSNELTGAAAVGMRAVLLRVPDSPDIRRRPDDWSGAVVAALSEVLALTEAWR